MTMIIMIMLIMMMMVKVSLMLHVLVPELRNSMFSWMKMSHLLAMFWSYLILFILYICGLDLVTEYPFYCKLLGEFNENINVLKGPQTYFQNILQQGINGV